MNKPLSFQRVTRAVTTNIILPWDKRVGAIRRVADRVAYLYSPSEDLSHRTTTPVYEITGYGPESAGAVDFRMTFTQEEWAKVQFLFGVANPYGLTEASPELAWGGYDWEDEEQAS